MSKKLSKVQPVSLSPVSKKDIQELLEYQNNIVFHRISAFENAVKFGHKISEIKEKIQHGSFKQWVNENIDFVSYRTIANYMQIAKNEHELRIELSEKLEIKSSLKWLANKKKKNKELSPKEEKFKGLLESEEKKTKKSQVELRKQKAKKAIKENKVEQIEEYKAKHPKEAKELQEQAQVQSKKKKEDIIRDKRNQARYDEIVYSLSGKEEKEKFLLERKEELEHAKEEIEHELLSIEELLKSIE